jgi:hypothetical protein
MLTFNFTGVCPCPPTPAALTPLPFLSPFQASTAPCASTSNSKACNPKPSTPTPDQLTDYFHQRVTSHSWSAVKLDLYGFKFYTLHVLGKPCLVPPAF